MFFSFEISSRGIESQLLTLVMAGWIDLGAGVSGTLFMALFPMGDVVANNMFNRFQRACYDILES